MTHIAVICSSHEIQLLLPQVILVGQSQMSAERFDNLRRRAPPGVHLWRYPKAWASNEVMRRFASLLDRSLRAYRRTHRFILFFDVLKAHISRVTLRALASADFWVCVPFQGNWRGRCSRVTPTCSLSTSGSLHNSFKEGC